MKNKFVKLTSLLLALLMIFSLVACGKIPTDNENSTEEVTTEPEEIKPNTDLEIKISVLNGTTALGMAQMINKAKSNTDEMNYNVEVFAAADAITGPIVSGETHIAALPTNVAAKLYKASAGKVQLLALNTLGVLYLLQNGETPVTDFNALNGKTVYVPGAGSNPEYITAALLEANGLEVGVDVTIDATSYPAPDALQTALVSGVGGVEFAVLPEPKVTVITMKNANVKVAMNFTEKWESIYGENTLAQGCLVVNTEFAKAHPAEIKKFLEDYKASVDFIKTGSDEAIAEIVTAGILPNEAIAKKALPNCNICFIEGNEMKTAISVFYQKLFEADNKSILAVPDDNFYYVK